MNAFQYLYVKRLKNRIRQLKRKPVAILYLIGVIAYAVWMYFIFKDLVEKTNMGTPTGFVTVCSLMVLWSLPLSLLQYAKRKGLSFRKCDVHFLFVSPVSPKRLLLYGYGASLTLSLVMSIILIPIGILWFHVPLYKMVLYSIVSEVVQNILDMSIIVLLYGNERLSERTCKLLGKLFALFVLAVIGVGVYMYFDCNQDFKFLPKLVNSVYLQVIPIIGWIIATYHLIFTGATTVNVICACLYLLTTGVLGYLALKLHCTGEYYEDAMKFTEEYEAAKLRSKKGEVKISDKQKDKLKKAKVSYKGHHAKAIFYRQLLEYKKKPFFIFGGTNILYLIAGIIAIILAHGKYKDGQMVYILAGIIAYIVFIFQNIATKWSKDLENPITFLIPDTAVSKLWYATAMEHICAMINGVIIVMPALVMGLLGVVEAILLIVINVCMNANKLYLTVLSEAILGPVLGIKIKQILRMILMSLCILLCGIVAFAFTGGNNIIVGVAAMTGCLLILTIGIAVAASKVFVKMEM